VFLSPAAGRLLHKDLRVALFADCRANGRKSLLKHADGTEYICGVSPLDEFFAGSRMVEITTPCVREFIAERQLQGVPPSIARALLRRLPHSFAQPPVVVNLPEYRLRAMNPDGTVSFYKKVIIGKAYGHKSPVFEKEIQYVVFRPYWEVTPSIQRNEIVPHIQRDPNYIAKHNFQVITAKGEVVTENAVSPEVLEGIKTGHLMVRQKPGPTNSLGLVKIIFPNPDNVYLHGTDAPQLFSQDVRDFSHGCIRVDQPADLVAWVLRNNPGWDLERVKATMNGDKEDLQVNLVTRIPVLIVYGTAAVNEENQIRFFDDIYGYDAALEKALGAGYPYAW
jgi:L,D-transpeptidase YcbB